MSCCFLCKLISLTYNSKQLPILLDFHDVVKDSMNLPIRSPTDPSHIKIYYLNYISMPSFQGHFDLIQKHFEYPILVAPFRLMQLYFLIHDLDGHSFIRDEVDAELDPG